jgi:hypothetical protein
VCDLSEDMALSTARTLYESNIDVDSDGGMINLEGSFGFQLGSMLMKGKGLGSTVIMSSTRVELCGIFAVVTYLHLVIEYCKVIVPNKGIAFPFYCESKDALSRVTNSYFDKFRTIWRCHMNYDLEVAIQHCLKLCPMNFDWQWVHGHASKRKRPDKFTRAETPNEYADQLVTEARELFCTGNDNHWPEQIVSVIGM